ncbi:hypothetical protein VTN00DRAFT_7574 [Thermoascus crustaceus]|uniref:uncharacterized protein n=1 Tax=Thermoascus crustaceus TaxID=5088 RepID=UPI0037433C17
MSQYLRMLLNLYQKCGFSASASASPFPPLGSPKHEGSRSSVFNRSPAANRRSFSSSSREENTDTDNTQRTRTRRKELDFSKLSQLIPDESATGTQSLWYVVTTAALLAFHHEPGVGELWAYISRLAQTEEQQITIARRIRESCLKASVLVGFPRGINGLLSLHSSLSTNSTHLLPTLTADTSLRAPLSSEHKHARGKEFFAKIYTRHTDRVLASMGASSGGDLDYYAVASIYGELMAETSIVGGAETGVLEFVCCLADGVAPQAKGHFFGCKNLGASGAQIRGTVSLVREVAAQLGLDDPAGGEEFKFLEKAAEW